MVVAISLIPMKRVLAASCTADGELAAIPDLDGDGVATSCDEQDGTLHIKKAKITPFSIKITGDFQLISAADRFTTNSGLLVKVQDSGSFTRQFRFLAFPQCRTDVRNRVACRGETFYSSSIGTAHFKPVFNTTKFNFRLSFSGVFIQAPLKSPLIVTVTTSPGELVTGIDRVGLVACRPKTTRPGSSLICK